MTTSTFAILFVAAFLACYGAMYWFDKRYGWQLVAWSNGEVDTPINKSTDPVESQTELTELRERVESLEKIVTESAYELNEKLRKL